MTPIQRKACLSVNGLRFGLNGLRFQSFARSMVRRGEMPGWKLIELTPRQLCRLALMIRRFLRQIGDDNLLFWAQRVLADAKFSVPEEEPCQQ